MDLQSLQTEIKTVTILNEQLIEYKKSNDGLVATIASSNKEFSTRISEMVKEKDEISEEKQVMSLALKESTKK